MTQESVPMKYLPLVLLPDNNDGLVHRDTAPV